MHEHTKFLTGLREKDVSLEQIATVTNILIKSDWNRAYLKLLPFSHSHTILIVSYLQEYKLVSLSYTEINETHGLDLVVRLTQKGREWKHNDRFLKSYTKTRIKQDLYDYMRALGFSVVYERSKVHDGLSPNFFCYEYKQGLGEHMIYYDFTGITSLSEVAGVMLKREKGLVDSLIQTELQLSTHLPPGKETGAFVRPPKTTLNDVTQTNKK